MMIDSTTEATYPENFDCPISFDLMTDPLVSIYGHHYQPERGYYWLAKRRELYMSSHPEASISEDVGVGQSSQVEH